MRWQDLAPHHRLPPVAAGMRIGLYGGSFNPAHEGHRKVSLLALQRLRLDQIWWLVSPGNPLKDHSNLPDTAARVAQAKAMVSNPRIVVTAFEEAIGTNYTVETIAFLKQRFPLVHFVWLMGADNLAGFHHWRGWQDIARMVSIAVIDRPGWTLSATASKSAHVLARYRKPENQASCLADSTLPAWVFIHGPRTALSSTQMRQQKK
ncbi:nicotinate-nucleotide adenylyltransferase [Microvirga sp. W0021]|uniref:Probable nicotinate-nucleotide adenylyltransferase n=1 Tax=Hohaiivirga grylli TaxID=3133970 RepID=A0ABV0BH53_9HYPH